MAGAPRRRGQRRPVGRRVEASGARGWRSTADNAKSAVRQRCTVAKGGRRMRRACAASARLRHRCTARRHGHSKKYCRIGRPTAPRVGHPRGGRPRTDGHSEKYSRIGRPTAPRVGHPRGGRPRTGARDARYRVADPLERTAATLDLGGGQGPDEVHRHQWRGCCRPARAPFKGCPGPIERLLWPHQSPLSRGPWRDHSSRATGVLQRKLSPQEASGQGADHRHLVP